MSVSKTMARVQEAYVWPGMKKTVISQLEKCGKCLVHRSRPEHVPMGDMPVANYPGQIVGIDLIGFFYRLPMDQTMY